MIFGDHLLSLSHDSVLNVWDYREGSACAVPNAAFGLNGRYLLSERGITWSIVMTALYSSIELGASYHATAMLHPETYLNKVVVANATGGLQLWNIRTRCVGPASGA